MLTNDICPVSREGLRMKLAGLFVLLLLGGCDGGIFGTGDGTSVGGTDPIVASAPGNASTTDEELDADSGAVEPPASEAEDSSAGEMLAGAPDAEQGVASPADTLPAGRELLNTLVADPTASRPQLRLLNVSQGTVTLRSNAAATANEPDSLQLPPVPADSVSEYVDLPADVSGLSVLSATNSGQSGTASSVDRTGADGSGSSEIGIGDTAALATFTSLLLDPGSATTLFVREAGVSADVVALPTRFVSDDALLGLVRLIPAGRSSMDGAAGLADPLNYRLVPAGENPGGVEIVFDPVTLGGDVSDGYLAVPAGDYRLLEASTDPSAEPSASSPRLSIAGGSATTLVIRATATPLVIADAP